MKRLILISFLAFSGCRPATDYLGFTHTDYTGKSCNQAYQQMAYLENRSSQTQNVTLAYVDPTAGGQTKYFTASIPAGGTLEKKLNDYTVEVPGYQGSDYPGNAYCDVIPKTSVVDLQLAAVSFASAKNCIVGDSTGLVYLIDTSAACPDFTVQQGAPL